MVLFRVVGLLSILLLCCLIVGAVRRLQEPPLVSSEHYEHVDLLLIQHDDIEQVTNNRNSIPRGILVQSVPIVPGLSVLIPTLGLFLCTDF